MKKMILLSALSFACLSACKTQPTYQKQTSHYYYFSSSASSSIPSQSSSSVQAYGQSSSEQWIVGYSLYRADDHNVHLTLGLEIMDTPEKREKGMMFRKDFGIANGMLFVFEQEQVLSFWMKNTLIPLDVIFFDENADFVSSATMVPCEADPCSIYTSVEPAKFALEVPAGFVKEHGIGKGWQFTHME